jgi:hypothetical protein
MPAGDRRLQLSLPFCSIGPVHSLYLPMDPSGTSRIPPRYTDGTPRPQTSPWGLFSVFRDLRLLATSLFCLRHRISVQFHPASLPDLFALVRCTVGALLWLSEAFRVLCMLTTDRLQPIASVLVSKLRTFTEFHLLSLVKLGRTSPLNPTAFRGPPRLPCLVLVLCLQHCIAPQLRHASAALLHLRNAYTHHRCFRFCPVPLRLHCSVPRPRHRSLPSSDHRSGYRSDPSLNMIGSYCLQHMFCFPPVWA